MIDQAMQLAIQHHQAGRLGEAETLYRRVLAEQPENPDALHLLGVIALQRGQPDTAIELIRQALRIDPSIANFHNNLGNALREKQLFEEASAAYADAVRLKPDFAEAYSNLGNVLCASGLTNEAIAACRQSLQLRPDLAEAEFNLGNALGDKGLIDDAIAAFRRAIALKPDHFEAYNNLGNALRDHGQLDESIAEFQRALQLKPDLAEAQNNLGNTLRDKGLVDEAIAAFREAIRLAPDLAEAHFSLSAALLLKGDFAQGWPEAEWRWQCERFANARRHYVQPRWTGEPLNGRTILLYADAGFGDTILFVRYALMVADRGGKVVLECQPELTRLLRGFPGVDKIIRTGEPPPHFDLHCPLFGLPLAFRTTLESIPSSVPYLNADTELVRRWTARLGASSGKKIGIVWAGNPHSLIDRKRSVSLSQFAPLAKIPGVTFYSLQKGEAATQASNPLAGMKLIDFTDELSDFADTAALIANLDLVIAAESAVAHLAGAMGKPVWVLTPFAPDWRWLLDRDDSPWFGTMRLFRQQSISDWNGVMDRVASALFEFAAK